MEWPRFSSLADENQGTRDVSDFFKISAGSGSLQDAATRGSMGGMSESSILSTRAADDPLFRWGRAWFRFRSFSPLPFFLLFVALPSEVAWTTPLVVAFAIYGLAGEAIRIWAVGFAGSVTRTRDDRVPALVHAGPYRLVRNPLYIGNFMIYTAAGLLFGFVWLTLAFAFYTALQYFLITEYEETLLKETFGMDYREYQEKVPRWLPALGPKIESSAHTFQLGRAINSEKSTLLALAAIVVLIVAKWW